MWKPFVKSVVVVKKKLDDQEITRVEFKDLEIIVVVKDMGGHGKEASVLLALPICLGTYLLII